MNAKICFSLNQIIMIPNEYNIQINIFYAKRIIFISVEIF